MSCRIKIWTRLFNLGASSLSNSPHCCTICAVRSVGCPVPGAGEGVAGENIKIYKVSSLSAFFIYSFFLYPLLLWTCPRHSPHIWLWYRHLGNMTPLKLLWFQTSKGLKFSWKVKTNRKLYQTTTKWTIIVLNNGIPTRSITVAQRGEG